MGGIARVLFSVLLMVSTEAAWGAGKKKTDSSGSNGLKTPKPSRKVFVRPIRTLPFTLPNGVQVDLTADLQTILNTAVTSQTAFMPLEVSGGENGQPCDSYIELRSAVTTLEMNATRFNIKFGYTAGNPLTPAGSIHADADVKISTVAMDFSVWQCARGECVSVAASTSNHNLTDLALNFNADFSGISGSANFLHNTPLGSTLRKIMNDGMKKLGSSPRVDELSWLAFVRHVVPEVGAVIFDAGTNSRLEPNQTFTVYALTPDVGACDVYRPVSHIHSVTVDAVSSTAVMDDVLDSSRGVQVGDVVRVKVNPKN